MKYEIRFDRKVNTPEYEFNYYNVRNNAWEFLLKNGVKSYPLDLAMIADKNNWLIWDYEKFSQETGENLEQIKKQHPNGMLVELELNSYLICYNDSFRQRNRFTIAHEMGHIVLHKLYRGDKLEREANMFASRILMPMVLIKELEISSAEELSKICDVSIEAARYRLERFNQIKAREKFYTNPLEIELAKNLKKYIQSAKRQ